MPGLVIPCALDLNFFKPGMELLLKYTIQMVSGNKVASGMFLLMLPAQAHITHALNCYGFAKSCLFYYFFTALIKWQIKLLTTCARMSARMDILKMFTSVLILCLWGVSCLYNLPGLLLIMTYQIHSSHFFLTLSKECLY